MRKLRWGVAGRGKRGGIRVIYYLRSRQGEVWMLTLYAKNEAESRRRDPGRARELKRGKHGRVRTHPSVTTIREWAGLSQARFAQLLGVSVRTL